eukprot:TRINITY_DN12114_c0_g1_i1.p1 TRINITY_DN12114_c0_g1~~TRINITY_DN12114_c0_g1_i1.p1  ORF type:complete len:428 (+),score=73.83 TRINITY_DN12114_c0_g1_i1:46-1329(+)
MSNNNNNNNNNGTIPDIEESDSLFSFESADEVPLTASSEHPMAQRLLAWYDSEKRDLPWRHSSDNPYKVWVSEIMLQQTRVSTVLKYYNNWMTAIPDVKTLSTTPMDDLRALWQGLGYYRRLEQLKKGATYVMTHYDGTVPLTLDKLLKIPGIGVYTAAAISSICGMKAHAAVDGNFYRVFARFDNHLSVRPSEKAFQKTVAARANSIISSSRPGDWNQAVMDLGSAICTPLAARCDKCPLNPRNYVTNVGALDENSGWCRSTVRHPPEDIVAKIPLPKLKVKAKDVNEIALVIADKSRMVLVKRSSDEATLSGLYEVPLKEHTTKEQALTKRRRSSPEDESFPISQLQALSPVDATACLSKGSIVFKFTHINFHIDVFLLKADNLDALPSDFLKRPDIKIATKSEVESLPVSTKIRRVIKKAAPFD